MMAMVPAPLWISILLFIVFSGLAMAAWFIDPVGRYFHGNSLHVETIVPEQVIIGEQFHTTLRITNQLSRPSTRIYVEIGENFMADVNYGTPLPNPSRIMRYHDKLLLEYESLPPGGQYVLQLPFIATQSGVAPFSAKIYAPSNQLRHEIAVPILVAQESGPAHPGGQLK